jgi:CheY-like chemotaxis protein
MPLSGSLRVLVVDDDALLRELVSARLRAAGYSVIEAASGDEAAALMAGANPDVLVTDIAMPGSMSGWELGERSRLLHPDIPIVYMSSSTPDPARMLTNSRFVQKPCHPDELLLAVDQLVSARSGSSPLSAAVTDVLT